MRFYDQISDSPRPDRIVEIVEIDVRLAAARERLHRVAAAAAAAAAAHDGGRQADVS